MNGSATVGLLIFVKERNHVRHISKCGKIAFDAVTHSMHPSAHLPAGAGEESDQLDG
jgi:hypothetical protein